MKTIRLIHNLPRSGGTIISKSLGAQKDVVLLSEIHPEGVSIRKKMGLPTLNSIRFGNLKYGTNYLKMMSIRKYLIQI